MVYWGHCGPRPSLRRGVCCIYNRQAMSFCGNCIGLPLHRGCSCCWGYCRDCKCWGYFCTLYHYSVILNSCWMTKIPCFDCGKVLLYSDICARTPVLRDFFVSLNIFASCGSGRSGHSSCCFYHYITLQSTISFANTDILMNHGACGHFDYGKYKYVSCTLVLRLANCSLLTPRGGKGVLFIGCFTPRNISQACSIQNCFSIAPCHSKYFAGRYSFWNQRVG